MTAPRLTLTLADTGATIEVAPGHLVVAGYTGRNEAAVREHIDELAALGIAPPPHVPMRYALDPALLTTAPAVPVHGDATSGEVEPVLLRHAGRWYLGVGSDHTDRALEREDIAHSKAVCPKPVGRTVLPLPDGLAQGAFDAAWDAGTVESTVDGEPYQSGPLTGLRTPSDLLERLGEREGTGDLAILAGTVPLRDGTFRHGRDWTLTLRVGDHTLTHQYTVTREHA